MWATFGAIFFEGGVSKPLVSSSALHSSEASSPANEDVVRAAPLYFLTATKSGVTQKPLLRTRHH